MGAIGVLAYGDEKPKPETRHAAICDGSLPVKSSLGVEYLERMYLAPARRVASAAAKIINGEDAIRLIVVK